MPVLRYKDPGTGLWEVVGAPGVTNHSGLTGLGNNDHPQYLLKTGGVVNGPLTTTGTLTAASATFTNGVDLAGSKITGAAAPVSSGDAVTKGWFDAQPGGLEEVSVQATAPTAAAPLDLWVDTASSSGLPTAAPFSILETTTTNTGQNITATTWTALPNTWSNGATLNFTTVTYPALIRIDLQTWFTLTTAVGTSMRVGIVLDAVAPTTTQTCYLLAHTTSNISSQMCSSLTAQVAAGAHTVTLQGYRSATATVSAANYTTLTVTFLRYIA